VELCDYSEDGKTLIAVGGVEKYSSSQEHADDAPDGLARMLFWSDDKGVTWSEPLTLVYPHEGVGEESDFCELGNGDLLFMHRVQIGSTDCIYLQNVVTKQGGKWVRRGAPRSPEGFKGGLGYPSLLRTREGVLLLFVYGRVDPNDDMNRVYWAIDSGTPSSIGTTDNPWRRLQGPAPMDDYTVNYYTRAIQLDNGAILCVGHRGEEDPSEHLKTDPKKVNMSITVQIFKLKFN
jgi:hypothetical protein